MKQPYPIAPLDYCGARLVIRADTEAECKWRTRIVAKEPRTVAWIDEFTRPGDIAYDIGANVGGVSLILAHKVGETGRVFAFEPGFASFAALCENAALNGFANRIVAVQMPLSDTGGIVCFKYRSTEAGGSRHLMLKADTIKGESAKFRQLMVAMSLDAFRRATGIPAPNVVKLDVDGAETAVVSGAQQTLAAAGCHSIVAEIQDDQFEFIASSLSSIGFKVISSWDRRDESPSIAHGYYLFRR
jgi:FkbM family methyltransferase